MSLTQVQEAPDRSLILLAGPPGAGKSTFCHQVVLNSLTIERPVTFVTTEQGPMEVIGCLRERGMAELPSGMLSSSRLSGISTSERQSASRLDTPTASGR